MSAQSLAETCRACGLLLDDDGCYGCGTCPDCMPGICAECRALRRENEADRMLRLSKEAQTWG